MKKSIKIILIVIVVIIGAILLDTAQAIILNNSPIIKVTKTYSSMQRKDIGIFVETYIFDGVTKETYFKWKSKTLPIEENLKTTYDKISNYFRNETSDRSNLGTYLFDEKNNVIEVSLVDNSKEKQDEFLKQTSVNSKYIKFKQGVHYTTLNFDFYINKLQDQNNIRFNDYYTSNNRTIYLANNIGEFYIKEQEKNITLKTYLSTAFQPFDDSIKHITDKLELKSTLKDGGTKIYKSKEKDITMIVCNTLKKDRNILIGDYSMNYTEGDCEN